jgi:hypothetical protein
MMALNRREGKMIKMLARTLCVFVLLVSQQLFAQAVPTAVPVEQEPRHRIVFQNKNVRIYDALIPPGDLTLFHTHSFDTVNVVVSGGKGMNEFQGKPPIQSAFITGQVFFNKATNAPYTHRLGNVGTTPIRVVGAEVLASSASRGVPAALDTVPGHKLVLENDLVKVYRVSVDPKQSTGVRSRTLPWLRISVLQSTISVQELGKNPETLETKPGDYRWYEGATTQSLENIGSTSYEAIEIELK